MNQTYNQRMRWVKNQCKKIGKYDKIIWVEENEDGTVDVYYTKEPFWYDFFHSDEKKGGK